MRFIYIQQYNRGADKCQYRESRISIVHFSGKLYNNLIKAKDGFWGKMKNRVHLEWIIVITGILVMLFLTLVTSSYYENVLQKVSAGGAEDGSAYRCHYVMIVEDSDMPFWQDVYDSTMAAAKEKDALVELMGKSLSSQIDMESLMDMAIAAKVDGIILEYTGGNKMDERIREAGKEGIPVVAVLKDDPTSSCISFVGVNDYQLGRQYGEQILSLVPGDKDMEEVMVLLHDRANSSQAQIFEQINNTLVTSPETSGRVNVTQENMQSMGKVDADETIRNIFFREQGVPDVLVCMEAVDTEAAYQAMIDYNKVGEIQLFGYYKSDQILEAVEKGIIPVTLVIDTQQMGRYCIQALDEFLKEGRVNSYYSVDLQFVTKDNVRQLMGDEQ